MPQVISKTLGRLIHSIIWLLIINTGLFVPHKNRASNNSHPGDESNYYSNDKDSKVAHLVRLPSDRILGTQRPTKIACCLLISASPRNHSVTLKTKLTNAATRK